MRHLRTYRLRYRTSALLVLIPFLLMPEAQAQFVTKWLDIGSYHNRYVSSGALHEGAMANNAMEWPAILRESDHQRARALWIGVRNWTSEAGEDFPYFVARIGPRDPGSEVVTPIQLEVISQFEDPTVEVDGLSSFDKVTGVDRVDPNIPAERMIDNVFNTIVGITGERKIHAWSNRYHDNYHIIETTYTNTGNTDDDDEIELPDQTLEDVFFFRIHRYTGNLQEAKVIGGGQQWGQFSMVDVVGDGHEDYQVDFTATYMWPGYRSEQTQFNSLGGPIWTDAPDYIAEGDSIGRLAGGSFPGRVVLHADSGPDDTTYVPTEQPYTLGFMDMDEPLTADGSSHRDYYELGIQTREPQTRRPNLPPGRMYPHYADRVEPGGDFDTPTTDASLGLQGGHANTVAYGPYTLAPGESITIVEAEGIDGLSYEARVAVGRAYKRSGGNDNLVIEYDADGDGTINDVPGYAGFEASLYDGDETMTKNQWVMASRDSLFQTFERAVANYHNGMALPEPPRPPLRFTVTGLPDRVELRWESIPGEPDPVRWEIHRTSRYTDNLPYECVAGCEGLPDLPGSERAFDDQTLVRGTDYYYYIVAVGPEQPVATTDNYLDGTRGGQPLKSSRYYTQTYTPVNLKRPPGTALSDARVVPNPVNLGSEAGIRFAQEDEIAFFNIPGECTIRIFSEIGELIKVIEHTDGSGDEKWNLTTDSRQLLVSGIYIAVIESSDGQRVLRPFTVIR